MNANETQAKIAAALSREEPLTSQECKALLVEWASARGDLGDRIARTGPEGVERMRALKMGTAEDVRRVEEEHEVVRILADQLQAQNHELSARRTAATHREALEALPGLYSSLDAKLDAAEHAARLYDEAVAAVRAQTTEITQTRGTIRFGGGEPEGGASMRAIRRVAAFVGQELGWVTDNIGCAVTRDVVQTAFQKFPDADYSDCTSDIAVMRTGVASVHGVDVEAWPDEQVVAKFKTAPFPEKRIQHGRRAA